DEPGAGVVVADVRFTKDRPSFRLAMGVRVAALQLTHPDVACRGWVVARPDGSSAKVPAWEVSVCGEGDDRLDHAAAYLRTVHTLLQWARRDAVPLFERLSATVRAGKAPKSPWQRDLFDDAVATLWGSF